MESKTDIVDDFILEYTQCRRKARQMRFYGKVGVAKKQELVKFLYIQRIESHGGENRTLERRSFHRMEKAVFAVGVLTSGGRYYCWKSRIGSRGMIRQSNLENFKDQFLKRFYYDSSTRICLVDCGKGFVHAMFNLLATIVACNLSTRSEKNIYSRLLRFAPKSWSKGGNKIKSARIPIFKRLCETGVLDFAGENLYTLVQNMSSSDGLAMSRCAVGIFYMWWSKRRSEATMRTPKYAAAGKPRMTGLIVEEENT